VRYVRVSRGVGASVTTWRRRVPAKKGSAKSTTVQTTHVAGYHLGVDMMAPKGTDVHAVGDATVGFAGRRRGFGNVIILDHGRGYQTYYAHLSKIGKGIKAGAQVARGEVIGLVGSTGHSTAPHLHFETRKDARYLDPFDETRELGFWLLTPDEQEKLAMQILSATPAAAEQATAQR
jgi:murein DD-endopeptidase MepM/ murein hydrolase activator NlpD